MAKRERKAWVLIGPRGNAIVIDSRYCADVDRGQMFVGDTRGYCACYEDSGDQVVRCTITWDDGKPEKLAANAKPAKAATSRKRATRAIRKRK